MSEDIEDHLEQDTMAMVDALSEVEIARRYGPSCVGMPVVGTTRSAGGQWMLRSPGSGEGWFTAVRQPGAPTINRRPRPCSCAQPIVGDRVLCQQGVLTFWEARLRRPGATSTVKMEGDTLEDVLVIFPDEIADRYRAAITTDD